jgi:outer membrane protein assembly factor BamB
VFGHEATRRVAIVLTLLVAAVVQRVESADAVGSAAILLSPSVGPPTTATTVRGKGFSAGETVDLTFDATMLVKTHAGSGGRFTKQAVVPASALPGDHTIQATGESGGEVAEATFTVRTDWPQFHFDNASTGYNPYENVLGPANVSGLDLSWTLDTGANIMGSPAVVGGVGYVAGNESVSNATRVLAFDTATGSALWHRTFVGGGGGLDPTVWGGAVYVSSLINHAMFALNARSGKTLWIFSTTGSLSAAVVSAGILYTASTAGQVFALDARTGAQIWASANIGSMQTGLALSGGLIYVGTYDREMYALDQTTGGIVWSQATSMPVITPPAVADSMVFIGCSDGKLFAFDAITGAQLWVFPTGQAIQAGPSVGQGNVFVGTVGEGLYAFDEQNGAVLWHVTALGDFAKASPVVANGVVYAGNRDDNVYAFDALTGEQLWSHKTGFLINSSPALTDGDLYIGSYDDKVYSFRLP